MDIVIKIYQAFEYKHKLTYLVHVIRANIVPMDGGYSQYVVTWAKHYNISVFA